MLNKPKRNSKVSIAIIQSKSTECLYIGMIVDDQPYKLWRLDDMSIAGVDLCNEIMRAFDLGYCIECQLPTVVDGVRKIVPLIYNLNDADSKGKEDSSVKGVKEVLDKIIAPADVPIFAEYDKNDSIISDACGITDDYIELSKKNIDTSPVCFADEPVVAPSEEAKAPDNAAMISFAAAAAPPSDEYFCTLDSDNTPVIPEYTSDPVPFADQPVELFSDSSNQSISEANAPAVMDTPLQITQPVSSQPICPDTAHNPFMVNSTEPEKIQNISSVTGGIPIVNQQSEDTDMTTCPNGHVTPKQSKFCIHCGAKIEVTNNYEDLSDASSPAYEPKLTAENVEPPSSNGFLSSYLQTKS